MIIIGIISYLGAGLCLIGGKEIGALLLMIHGILCYINHSIREATP